MEYKIQSATRFCQIVCDLMCDHDALRDGLLNSAYVDDGVWLVNAYKIREANRQCSSDHNPAAYCLFE